MIADAGIKRYIFSDLKGQAEKPFKRGLFFFSHTGFKNLNI